MKALFSLSSNMIPELQFEKDFMAITGLTLDMTRFAFAFIGAVASGFFVRWIRYPAGTHEHHAAYCSTMQDAVPAGSAPLSQQLIAYRSTSSRPAYYSTYMQYVATILHKMHLRSQFVQLVADGLDG